MDVCKHATCVWQGPELRFRAKLVPVFVSSAAYRRAPILGSRRQINSSQRSFRRRWCGHVIKAVAQAEKVEQRVRQTPASLQSLRVQLQMGKITAAGCQPMLEEVNAEAFISRSSDEALILGIESGSGASSMHDVALGKLRCKRFLACARNKLWWMTPEWGRTARDIPPETQFLLLELEEGGPYAVLLPLIDNNTFRATLRPLKFSKAGDNSKDAVEKLHLRIESGDPNVLGHCWNQALYIAAGWQPFELVERAVAAAAALSGGAKPRQNKMLPPSLDFFGWCSWDAFFSRVSAQGLHEGLQSLADGGVPARMLIIDDGWQSTDVDPEQRQLTTKKLQLPSIVPAIDEAIDNTGDEFLEAELEMIKKSARDVPAGSTLGVALEALSADEDNLEHHQRSKSNLDMPWRKSRRSQSSGEQQYESSSYSINSQDNFGDRPSSSAADSTAASEAARKDAMTLARADAGTLSDSEAAKLIENAGLQSPEPHRKMPLMWVMSALTQRFVGLFVGLLEAVLIKIYQYVVDPAPPGSLPSRAFAAAANGPLRGLLLDFFAASGDFSRRLTSIEANSKFSSPFAGPDDYFSGRPAALGDVVTSLKERFQLAYVYCWHGLPAYWSGVARPEDAPAVAQYGAELVFAQPTDGLYEIEPSTAWNPGVIGGVGVVKDVRRLYNDMHKYLARSGVSGVKVDCQAGVGLLGSRLGGGPQCAAEYHAALESSVATHFRDNHVINCMCHSTENLYRMQNTVVVRASDDFYPRNEASSHPHVGACAFNSVFLAGLAQPDWDMFHSQHPAALLHATARAVSGGAVYVSDYPGKHDFDVLRKLVLPDGTVLRALLPGRPTRDTLFQDVLRDDKSLLKVWNMNAYTGVVAVFHLQGSSWDRARRQFVTHNHKPKPLDTIVRPMDVETFVQSARSPLAPWSREEDLFTSWIAASSHATELVRLQADEGVPISLTGGGCAVVTLSPVLEADDISFAPVGLVDMLNSGGAVLSASLEHGTVHTSALPGSNGQRSSNGGARSSRGLSGMVHTRGCGRFVMYASQAPVGCLLEGQVVDFQYDQRESRLTVDLPSGPNMLRGLQVVF